MDGVQSLDKLVSDSVGQPRLLMGLVVAFAGASPRNVTTLKAGRYTISVTDDAKKWILDKTLVDRSYGARPLRRALQRYVEDPLSEALIAGHISTRPAFLEVYLDANQLFYRPVSSDETGTEEKAAGILLFSA